MTPGTRAARAVESAESGGVSRGGVESTKAGRRQDRIFGLIGGFMILLAVVILLKSLVGPEQVATAPPGLELVSPADGDTLSLPVEVRLRSAQPLSMQPGGWGANNFHLHMEVAGSELMPGPSDIRPASGNEYVWTLTALPSGVTTVRLFWADAAHRAVAGGASEAVQVLIR